MKRGVDALEEEFYIRKYNSMFVAVHEMNVSKEQLNLGELSNPNTKPMFMFM